MVEIKDIHKNNNFRFFKCDKNKKPIHPAYDLIEEYHDKQPNGTWLHKITKLVYRVKGDPYIGEAGNYAYDDPEFLEFLLKQKSDYVYGIIGLHGHLSNLYGPKIIGERTNSTTSGQLNLKTYDNYFKKLKHDKNNFYVENLIWKNSITMFYADTENLKSMLAVIYLGMCVASGKELCKQKSTH